MAAATTIAAVAAVASAATGAASAYQQSQAAKSQADYQAQVANNNAIIAQQNAERLRQYGSIAEDEQRERLAQTRGAARARLAANGLLVEVEGSIRAAGQGSTSAGRKLPSRGRPGIAQGFSAEPRFCCCRLSIG